MKEYTLGFDGFRGRRREPAGRRRGPGLQAADGDVRGARIQTAARAVGVAQNALELGLPTPRIASSSASRSSVPAGLRQAGVDGGRDDDRPAAHLRLGRQKDLDQRCDIEAGFAKLLAARVAWSNADNAVQIHGGNGYALEYPISRVLCDARILNVFEGAAEIQAHVVARGLLSART
jgi:alkylation response protein AidB-like acyl-CoA dehydrogenase